MYINRAFIYGHITKDVELKVFQSGGSVANFSVATNRTWKSKDGEKKEDVQFHNCVAYGKTAELVSQYMTKGSAIFIEGRIQTRSWETKEGSKRQTTEIVAENIQFGPKKTEPTSDSQVHPEEATVDAEDLPF